MSAMAYPEHLVASPTQQPRLYDLWQRHIAKGGTTFRKRHDAETVQECMEFAFHEGSGVFEIWDQKGIRLVSFMVGKNGFNGQRGSHV